MPGPLPSPNARRRNAPTIPTTNLPAAGRKGRPPRPPAGYRFGDAAEHWWRWAWRSPQAAAWDSGALYHLARRAQLEDDLAALSSSGDLGVAAALDVEDLLTEEQHEIGRRLDFMIGRLKAMAGGRLAVMKEMRELDARLGLNPEALAKLRWTISDGGESKPAAPVAPVPAGRPRLRAVDPAAAAVS